MKASGSMIIVEDDPVMLRGLTDVFVRDGFTVRAACDGHSAVELILDGSTEPDIVLLDLMLPGLDGLQVCRTLRSEGFENAVLVLTARGREDDIVKGLEAGADDYLAKPFGLEELRARVHALLRRQRRGLMAAIPIGAFQWEPSACRLTKGVEEIRLSPQERSLLGFLVASAGRALTRDALLRAMARRSPLTSTRAVDQVIASLRAILGDNPRSPRFIVSVREIGYRMDLPDARN